jgi:hypothetical protein
MKTRTRTLTIATATALLAGGSAIVIAPAAQAKTVPNGTSYWTNAPNAKSNWPSSIAVKRTGNRVVIANPLSDCFKGKRAKGAKFRGGSMGNGGMYVKQTWKMKVKKRSFRSNGVTYYRISPAKITGSNARTWLGSC